ncbi:hypothetical protein ACWEWX_02010 [Streptomyces asiaticus]
MSLTWCTAHAERSAGVKPQLAPGDRAQPVPLAAESVTQSGVPSAWTA